MKFTRVFTFMALAGLAGSAYATNGYFAHGYGMSAKGMGGAGIAYPQDTLAAATNPAGMVHLGNRMDIGLEIFAPDRGFSLGDGGIFDSSFNPLGPSPAAASYDGSGSGAMESWFPIPEFGYNRMINNDMSFGVSVFGNGGMNTTYADGDHPFAGGSGAEVGIDLMQMFIAPTIAYKVNKQLSVGASLNLVAASFEAKGLEGLGVASNGKDYSFGVGVRMGAMYQVNDAVTLGATYQTKTDMSKFDDYGTLFPNSGEFDIPANYGVGIAFKPNDKFDIAFDVIRIEYEKVDVTGNPATGMANGGFGWKNQTVYKLGAAYQYNDGLTLRAGFNYGKNPVELDDPASPMAFTLNTLAPGIVEKHLTLGFTKAVSKDSSVTGAYMHAFKNEADGIFMVPVNANPDFWVAPGSLEMSQNAFGLSYNKKL